MEKKKAVGMPLAEEEEVLHDREREGGSFEGNGQSLYLDRGLGYARMCTCQMQQIHAEDLCTSMYVN